MADNVDFSEGPPKPEQRYSGEKAPVQTHNTPILPTPEQKGAMSDVMPDTRDGYVNIVTDPGARPENNNLEDTAIIPPAEQSETEPKPQSKRRILLMGLAATAVVVVIAGIGVSAHLSNQPKSQSVQAAASASKSLPTTSSYLPTTAATVSNGIIPEATSSLAPASESSSPSLDRTEMLKALSEADAEKIQQYAALPHATPIQSEADQQKLVQHSCKGFDLWLRTNNEGQVADRVVGGGNIKSNEEIRASFESLWGQTRTFLGREFGQEGLPILSCEGSYQVAKNTENCNNSTQYGTTQDLIMNVGYVTLQASTDNRVPVVQLHFKRMAYCPAFDRKFGQDPVEVGHVVVNWSTPEVRLGSMAVDSKTWQLSDPRFDATTPQGKWQRPDPENFYTGLKSR